MKLYLIVKKMVKFQDQNKERVPLMYEPILLYEGRLVQLRTPKFSVLFQPQQLARVQESRALGWKLAERRTQIPCHVEILDPSTVC